MLYILYTNTLSLGMNEACHSTSSSQTTLTASMDRLQRKSRLASLQRARATPPTKSPSVERSQAPPNPYQQAILAHRSELHLQRLAAAIQKHQSKKKLKGRALQIKRELDRTEEPKSLYRDGPADDETATEKLQRRKRALRRTQRKHGGD